MNRPDILPACRADHLRSGLGRFALGMCIAVLPGGWAHAQNEAQNRIDAITLSTGGLAEIRRSMRIDAGTSELGFDVPLGQVDDILKSLLVRDPAGGVTSVALDGLAPVEEAFRSLPFSPEDMNDLPRLLGALQGIEVRATSGGRMVEGAVLGVQAAHGGGEGEDGKDPLLSVMTAQGRIDTLRLRADTELDILDEAMRERLREAAAASGRSRIDDMRAISITIEGEEAREVLLDYVVPAPVWKTAYRLIAGPEGTQRLQAWAVIENATGEAWQGVDITLSSGAPVTLSQRLHQRYWHERPEIPVMAQTAAPPRPDSFAGSAADMAEPLSREYAMSNAESLMLPQAAPASAPKAQAETVEGEVAAIYRLPYPVDLGVGRTLSVPFIDVEIEAERIALFQPESGSVHPVSAMRLANSTGTSLPPGLVTVYGQEGEGYAGDAQLQGMPPNDSRMVSFAADRKVEVATERGREETVYRATLAEGVLRATRITRADTVYRIKGAADGARNVVIEHPRRPGWRFSSEALAEETPTHHRLRAEIEAGGSASITATSERSDAESIALVEADTDALVYWSGRIDDPAIAATLSDLAERRRAIARAEEAAEEAARDIGRAAQDQARIRDNLAAVPQDSALGRRYISMLEDEENRIAKLGDQRRQAEETLATLREDFANVMRDL